ncbi:kinase-like domain-containing protein [Syncephalis fuscata]|nr:kinase-like domain-containing protein [Syncephalis fuscata]
MKTNQNSIRQEEAAVAILNKPLYPAAGNGIQGKQYVAEIYNMFPFKTFYCFVYSYGGNMALDEYVKLPEVSNNKAAILSDVFNQVLLGLTYLHQIGLAHNDVKPQNIMINTNAPNSPTKPKVTLIDFDASVPLKRTTQNQIVPALNMQGTQLFVPPETYHGKPFDLRRKDSWAAGLTFFITVTGVSPYANSVANANALVNEIGNLDLNNWSKPILPQLNAKLQPSAGQTAIVNMVNQLLTLDATKRPTPEEYLTSASSSMLTKGFNWFKSKL